MFQAIGLTKSYRRGRPPAVLDLSFDAREGQVTALLGAEGSGRSTTLRLALGLEQGHGTALFDGRPYLRLRRPEQVVGTVLGAPGELPGHPGRRARTHLRMMAAAAGAPARRADQLLEQTRLAPAAGHRLRTYSPGMNRRLALAEALLGDPGMLILDEPTLGLSPKNTEWFQAFLRAFAAGGGSVLVTLRDPRQAAALADRVVTLDTGRIVQDQTVADFSRTRLHDEVVVGGPQVARLADLLVEAGASVRRDGGTRISVSGASRTEIGELAYRHGILLHELADRSVEVPPRQEARREALLAATARSTAARSTAARSTAVGSTEAPNTAPRSTAEVTGETVVVLAPGTAVAASVSGATRTPGSHARVDLTRAAPPRAEPSRVEPPRAASFRADLTPADLTPADLRSE